MSLNASEDAPHHHMDKLYFQAWDYALFALLLVVSCAIGLYYGFFAKRKQDTTEQYMLGGKKMNIFAVSASLVASHVSATTLLGVPADIYAYGTQYWMIVIPVTCVAVSLLYIYLPVYHDMQVASSFQYLEKRYNRKIRLMASIVFLSQCITYTPIVIYGPSIAFAQVTGIHEHIIGPLICVICIFYTTIGGLKAVVWTDFLQFIIMMAAIMAVIFLGMSKAGGWTNVWKTAEEGGRLIFFDMDPSPFVRISFWTMSIGMTITWISFMASSPGCVQRFLSVRDLSKARNSVYVFVFGLIFIKSCSCFTGLIMYALYSDCDPMSVGLVSKIDQMVPYFVMDVTRDYPGLPGLFVAGIFSAALSSLSSVLNSAAGSVYEDFIRDRFPNKTEAQASAIMKWLVVALGALNLGLIFLVERLGSILTLSISFAGVTAGPLLGIFTMGMTYKKGNAKGAIWGSIVSMVVVGTILVGSHINKLKHPWLPMSTENCDIGGANSTLSMNSQLPSRNPEDVHWLFRISFLYYSVISCAIFAVVAVTVSHFTTNPDDKSYEEMDQRMLAPFCRDQKLYRMQREQEDEKYQQMKTLLTDNQREADAKLKDGDVVKTRV